jgi:hypothetical protein
MNGEPTAGFIQRLTEEATKRLEDEKLLPTK